MKRCFACKTEKSLEDFNRMKSSKDGRQHSCRTCQRERWATYTAEKREHLREQARRYDETHREERRAKTRAFNARHPERVIAAQRKHRYGLTPEQYEEMRESQQAVCPLCLDPLRGGKAEHIDHCHATGRVRGLLCINCNLGLGQFRDNPDALRRAADYLAA